MILDKTKLPNEADAPKQDLALKIFERKQQWERRQVDLEADAIRGEKAKWLLEKLNANLALTADELESMAARYDQVLDLTVGRGKAP